MPSWPEIHGALTHFPVALLITACVFDLAAALCRKPQGRLISFWLLVAAGVMAVPSLVAGWMTGDQLFGRAPEPPRIFVLHRGAAFATSGIALVLLAWRAKSRDQLAGGARAASLALMCLAGIGAAYTGFLGGRMLFGGQNQVTGHEAHGGGEAHAGDMHGEEPHPGAPRQSEVDPARVKAGERLFRNNGCTGCHKMNGVGASGGPDLTHEGQHQPDLQWQVEHLKNPAKMSPGSMMPSFARLKPDELKALAEYLVTRRGEEEP